MPPAVEPLYPVLVPVAAAAAFLLALALVWLLRHNLVPGLRILDHPNDRSLHRAPVPRTGGVGLVAASLSVLAALTPIMGLSDQAPWIALAVLTVGATSLVDDRGHVPAQYRLAAQLTAAALFFVAGLRWEVLGLPGLPLPLPGWLAFGLTLALVTWLTNLYNFMDGMDGLAGGMAVFGFGALAVFGLHGGAWGYALVCGVISAAAAGFLVHNLPRAGIFLGDLGSALLGLCAAGLILAGAQRSLFPLWAGLLVFSPFIVDATWTLANRAARAEAVWRAHREHHYQRLILAGWPTRKTLLWAYVLMAAAGATAFAGARLPVGEQWLLLAGWAGIYALIHLRVDLAERAKTSAPPPPV
jgi:UDP-N-acetylmuramyl pentapeptide phosphotransferase/UDP-N-acetylglucosamine-1-phosphate transferase